MKIKSIIIAGFSLVSMGIYTSCEDMMDTSSSLVMFSEDNTLDQATDTVYSVMGIISKIQAIADQTVLLGEIRGDLVELSSQASVDLQQLAQFNIGDKNVYNAAEGYYAIINNCNFFLAKVDTSLKKRNEYVFQKEYAAVKTYRAWTYLQLAMIYGTVPFITEPILTEAAANKTYPMYGVKELCDFFVNDLTPYVNVPFPNYGAINNMVSSKFFIPTRVVLGDLCLWAERYFDASRFYHDYLTLENNIVSVGTNQISWDNESKTFTNLSNSYSTMFSSVGDVEIVSYIPMETLTTERAYSGLRDVFNSTVKNYYFYQAKPSQKLIELSKAQSNCLVYRNGALRDTLFAPEKNDEKPLLVGDLRLSSVYLTRSEDSDQPTDEDGSLSSNTNYSTDRQTISKFSTGNIILYRRGQIYLRFAEAMNRAGFPESAFAVLKYGLYPSTIGRYINARERENSSNLLWFSQYSFSTNNTIGIHSRGAGDASSNDFYKIPTLSSLSDSINYVEDMISNESALETSFEGFRFYDLVRMALHKKNNAWLAEKIAGRKGSLNYDQALYNTLLNKEKWYLPLK